MNGSKTLHLLLVEDDPEDQRLLCQALAEIEESGQWCNWRSSSIMQVEQLADAIACLRREPFDAILLNLSLPDSPVLLHSFLEANCCARGTPIVILADEEDENLAHRLLREGAQDVVVKSELECKGLARSLRYAIERQRRNSGPMMDHLTGTLTRQGFLTIAGYYARLSRQRRQQLLLASLEIVQVFERTQEERESAHLLLMRAAEALRESFDSPSLLGRLGRCHFALMTSGLAETTVEALLNRVAADIESAAPRAGQPCAKVRFSLAELGDQTSPEELVGEDGEEFLARYHNRVKTVMLAD